jgi:hypothetical protein
VLENRLVDGDLLNQIKPLNQFERCKCLQNHAVATFSTTDKFTALQQQRLLLMV